MAAINIDRSNPDRFFRYKMEPIHSKVEGKGNGIKTVIVNLSSVAHSLARNPSYVIKYFGFELGAQTNNNPSDDRWIINGAHEAAKLQDYLDGFIKKFVLCQKCKNPETEVRIKEERIYLDCKACGQTSDVDLRHKLSGYILKQMPKKGKKDKSTKKAERKARKEAERNGDVETNGKDSPQDSNSDHGVDDDGNDNEDGIDAGSDDELTRQINEEAKKIETTNGDDVQWSVDTSEAAAKARAEALSEELKNKLTINGAGAGGDDDEDGEGGESNEYNTLGNWITETTKEKGGVKKIDDVDIFLKAKELGIEKKHKTLTVLAQTIFDDDIVKEIDGRAAMLKKMISSEKHEKAFLGGTERFVGIEKPNLIPVMSSILMKYYDNDLVSEEVLKAWGKKASKKYVDISTSKKVRKSAEKFMEWLETAEEESEEESE